VLVSAFGFAPGIADADRVGASTKAQAANPINKSRFMVFPPWIALSRYRVIAVMRNASPLGLFHGWNAGRPRFAARPVRIAKGVDPG
jgi:hypothetical protein